MRGCGKSLLLQVKSSYLSIESSSIFELLKSIGLKFVLLKDKIPPPDDTSLPNKLCLPPSGLFLPKVVDGLVGVILVEIPGDTSSYLLLDPLPPAFFLNAVVLQVLDILLRLARAAF